MILSGRLVDWSLNDLLQILRITEKTATLEIEGEHRRGTLYFRAGGIVDAELESGDVAGATFDRIIETIYELKLLADGAFAVGTHERDTGTYVAVPEAIEAADRHLEAEHDLRTSGILEGGALTLAREIEAAVTLDREQWQALAELTGSFSFDEIAKRLGRVRAVSFVNSLRRQEAIAQAHADAPTWWQDAVGLPEAVTVADQDDTPGEGSEGGEGSEDEDTGSPAPQEYLTVVRLDTLEDEGLMPEPLPQATDEAVVGRRREMKAVISPVDTTLVPGVLGDLRQRFRPVDDQRLS